MYPQKWHDFELSQQQQLKKTFQTSCLVQHQQGENYCFFHFFQQQNFSSIQCGGYATAVISLLRAGVDYVTVTVIF